jgi:hypothetical protein
MFHGAVVIFQLPGVPMLVGIGDVALLPDFLAKAGEQNLFTLIHEFCPELNPRFHRQMPNAGRREFGRWDELISHTLIVSQRRR